MDLKENEIQITDNYLPQEQFESISDKIFDEGSRDKLYFNYISGVNYQDDGGFMFTANLIDKVQSSDALYFFGDFFAKLNPSAVARAKVNIITKTETSIRHGWHIDYEKDVVSKCLKTSILYLNTTNGKTYFKNGKSIDCVANRLVTFPFYMEHASSTQTDENIRAVLNVNWY